MRPDQLDDWIQREEDKANAAARSEAAELEAASATADGNGSGDGGGAASLIPAHLLERSKAAKARLLG